MSFNKVWRWFSASCKVKNGKLFTAAGIVLFFIVPAYSLQWVSSCETDSFATDIKIRNGYAFVAEPTCLEVFRIADPGKIILVKKITLAKKLFAVCLAGNYAYVGSEDSSLYVFDVSNPENTTLVSRYPLPDRSLGVSVRGNRAYVTATYSGVYILDITDPRALSLVGSYNTPGMAYYAEPMGTVLYVSDYYNGIQVLDMTDPTAMRLISNFDSPSWSTMFEIKDTMLYIADAENGIRLVSCSDPRNLYAVKGFTLVGYDMDAALDIKVQDSLIYVCGRAGALYVFVQNTSPYLRFIDHYFALGHGYHLAIDGSYIYMANRDGGIQVFRLSQLSREKTGACIQRYWAAKQFILGKNSVYYGVMGTSVKVDISNPLSPATLPMADLNKYYHGIDTVNGYGYFTEDRCSLDIKKVETDSFQIVKTLQMPQKGTNVLADGNYLYINNEDKGISIYDVTDPLNPVLNNIFDGAFDGMHYRKTYIVNDSVLFCESNNRVYLLNRKRRPSLSKISTFSLPYQSTYDYSPPFGNYIFISRSDGKIFTLDINAPLSPHIVDSISLPGYPHVALFRNNTAYINDMEYSHIWVADIVDSIHLEIKGVIPIYTVSSNISYHDGYLYTLGYSLNIVSPDVMFPYSAVIFRKDMQFTGSNFTVKSKYFPPVVCDLLGRKYHKAEQMRAMQVTIERTMEGNRASTVKRMH